MDVHLKKKKKKKSRGSEGHQFDRKIFNSRHRSYFLLYLSRLYTNNNHPCYRGVCMVGPCAPRRAILPGINYRPLPLLLLWPYNHTLGKVDASSRDRHCRRRHQNQKDNRSVGHLIATISCSGSARQRHKKWRAIKFYRVVVVIIIINLVDIAIVGLQVLWKIGTKAAQQKSTNCRDNEQ